MPREEPPRCLVEGGVAEVLGAPPVADPCPFLVRVDAHLRGGLGGSLGPLRRAVRVHPDAYWRLHYPGALDGFVPLDLAAVTEREVALGRARLLLDPRTQVLEALPPPGGPGSKARWQARVGTPERLVCAVGGARVEVRLDLEFTPPWPRATCVGSSRAFSGRWGRRSAGPPGATPARSSGPSTGGPGSSRSRGFPRRCSPL